ncbi:hypothetical protein NQZ68_022407 [Dissostichus eleginoides]|nr:hypothetical protein NQZ68_022407 [Dissostichus eleginoides]
MSQPGSKVTFECRMGDGLSMSSNTMFWYRQDHPGAAVQFLTKEYDEAAGNLVSSIDPSQNTFSLHISGLQLSDSSTYYCAAKHSAALRAETRTDNRPLQLEHRLIWFCTEMTAGPSRPLRPRGRDGPSDRGAAHGPSDRGAVTAPQTVGPPTDPQTVGPPTDPQTVGPPTDPETACQLSETNFCI